jgi:hypothetical protein
VKQLEGFNCGPIACTKILEIFELVTEFEVKQAYNIGSIRTLVTQEWQRFLRRCNTDLIVRVQDRRPANKKIPDVAAVLMVVEKTTIEESIKFNPLEVCFCFDDKPHQDVIHLKDCCKQFIHRECILIHLGLKLHVLIVVVQLMTSTKFELIQQSIG